MKQRLHTTTFNSTSLRRVAVVASALVIALFSVTSTVFADTLDTQIKDLQDKVSSYQNEAGRLRAEADTLQNALGSLTAQKQAIQTKLDLSQAQLEKLNADITANQAKLEKQQNVLGSTISDLSAESTTSPIELLAGSSSIGDFIDRQEYRSSVQEQIQSAITEVQSLKLKLAEQKSDLEKVLANQKQQRDELAAKEAEQATLLAQTQGQEASYQAMVNDANGQIGKLRAQQAAQIAATRRHAAATGSSIVAGSPSRGGYPAYLANSPMDTIVDDWGMYNRECVSYTAWKVYQKNGYMQHGGGRGHAYQWPTTFNVAQGNAPRAQSVVVWNQYQIGGGYGHVAWVESVGSDGSIYVSQYNYGSPGNYSEMRVSASQASQLTYLYF
ncbi:MAG TPA: CHAP domain-containing protein [Candidatus Saccharimonadales bacterium]|jgi:peptidoglycan hydrolase CwlO-like protein